MRYIPIAPILIALVLAGCGASRPDKLGEEEYRGATAASATTRTVANDPALKGSLPEHSRILVKSADLSDAALQVEKKREDDPLAVGDSLVTPEELEADPAAAADSADAKADAQMQAVTEEQEQGLFSKILSWGGWASLAGAGVWIARTLGVPGVQFLTDPLVKMLGGKKLKELEQRSEEMGQTLQHYMATVESSVVGRKALLAIDGLIGDDIRDRIRTMTNGQADSVEGLFKWAAQTHARDRGEHDSTAVATIVDVIKDRLPTEGALPELVNSMLARLQG